MWRWSMESAARGDQTREGTTSSHHLGGDGFDDIVHDRGLHGFRKPRQWGVGAHAPGVGSGVTVGDPLEILSRHQRNDGLSVDQTEQ